MRVPGTYLEALLDQQPRAVKGDISMRESLLMRLFRSWTYIKILLFGVGLCLIIWVALAELRLLPRFLTREVQAYFEWETQKGFGTFRIEKPETGQPSTAGDRAWQYLVAIQVKPRLREYFKNLGWQRINGRVSLEVTDFVPVAMPVGLGSDGDVLYDPAETPLMRAADEGHGP